MSHSTLALYCCMLLCVFVSYKFVSWFSSETSALALRVLGFTRRLSMENALGFSFGLTIFGESAVTFGGLAAEWNRRISPEASGMFLWLRSAATDRLSKPPFRPGRFIHLGLKRWSWSTVMEPPNETVEVPLFSRDSILRLRSAAWPQNETADRRFQRANVSFHMPSSWGL